MKKLKLNKITVRNLTGLQLHNVQGGLPRDTEVDEMCTSGMTMFTACPSDNCRSVINSNCRLCS